MITELVTKIGNIQFEVTARFGDISRATIETKKYIPKLPDGMSVESATLVLLSMPAVSPIEHLKFTCNLGMTFPDAYACSGEGLDAWEWECRSRLVMIGTEDGDWLGSRLNLGRIDRESYPVHLNNNIISIEIDRYSRDSRLTLHFVVSENPYPEIQDCSCWFSVDAPHDLVLNEFRRS